MADSTISPTVTTEEQIAKKCQDQLKAAGKYYEKNFVKDADRLANMYEVNHYYDEALGKTLKTQRDRIKVAYPYSNSRQILAEIFNGLPDAVVKVEKKTAVTQGIDPQSGQPIPESADQSGGAETLRQAIEYVKRRSNMGREVKMMALDGIVTGLGCVGISAQSSTHIPKYTRYLYRDIEADWTNITDIYESDWIACKLVRPLEDIKNDENYNTNRDSVRPAKLDELQYGASSLQYGVLWCWHNKKTDEYLVFPDDQPFLLVRKKLSEIYNFKVVSDDYKTDWPFVFFVNEERMLKPWGMGDIYPIESQVRELDKTRTQMINHRKRFNRKYAYLKGTLDAQGINQLKNPEDGTLVQFDKPIIDANFKVIQDAPMSSDVYNVNKEITDDIQVIGPLGPNSQVSGVGTQAKTLGQAQLQEQSSNTRLADKQKQLANTIAKLYKLTAQYIQQNWVAEDDLLVTGDGSKDSDWAHFDPQVIQGEYDYDVVPESMKDNSALYRQQMADCLNVVTPLLTQTHIYPAVAIMVRNYVMTFETLRKDVDTIVPPQYIQPSNESPIVPYDKPRVTLNLADFPQGVQIKGLALAGIEVTPDDFNTPMGLGATNPGSPEDKLDPQLEQLMQTNPAGFAKALAAMPPGERETIMAHIQAQTTPSANQAPQVKPVPNTPPGTPSVPVNGGAPSGQSIQTAATTIK